MAKEKSKDIKPLKAKKGPEKKIKEKRPSKTPGKKTQKKKLKAAVLNIKVTKKILATKTAKEKIPEEKPFKALEHPALIYKKYDNKVPEYYGDTRIVLLPRDSYWLFTYWEVSLPRIEEAKRELGGEFYSGRTILRVYEVTNIIFNGNNAHSYFDLVRENLGISYYFKVPAPEKTWVVDIGIITASGKFLTLARSNDMATPADSVSNFNLEEWMDATEDRKTYITKTGKGNRTGIGRGLYGEGAEETAFGALAGTGSSGSLSSPVKYEKIPSAFWMRVGTELIVYGAAEPGAKVTLNSTPVVLNPDGSFSARFALVDGIHKLNITGNSANGKYKQTYNITVTQDKKRVE